MIPQDHHLVIPRPSKSVFFEVSSSNVVDIVLKCRPQMSSVHWSSWQTLNPKPLVYKPQISNEIVNLDFAYNNKPRFYKHYYLVYDSFEISGLWFSLWFHLKSLVYDFIWNLWFIIWFVVIYDPTRSLFCDT